jgi:hypothetical protein
MKGEQSSIAMALFCGAVGDALHEGKGEVW